MLNALSPDPLHLQMLHQVPFLDGKVALQRNLKARGLLTLARGAAAGEHPAVAASAITGAAQAAASAAPAAMLEQQQRRLSCGGSCS